jgi:hypothetical protein
MAKLFRVITYALLIPGFACILGREFLLAGTLIGGGLVTGWISDKL